MHVLASGHFPSHARLNSTTEGSSARLTLMSQRGEQPLPGNSPAQSSQSRWAVVLACGLIAVAVLASYYDSLSGAFVFDDYGSIIENPTIRQLWPISRPLSPPPGNLTVSGRPLLNLSFALNYAFGGTAVWGYHAINLLIHLFAGWALLGIVRRTLLQPALRRRYGASALPLATAVAVLWVVHPLQTEAVTYIAQRAESLMGLFYLLTLYCFIRATESRAVPWGLLSVAACLCGMATKEVMATAPLMALLYDRTFVAGTFREGLRRRWRLYAGLGGTWLLLGWLVATGGDLASGSAGFSSTVNWRSYGLTQFRALVLYLKLSVWPHPLVLDYGGPVLIGSVVKALPYMAMILPLLAGTAISVKRWPAVGFAGCWFFGILALTSSVFPLSDTMFEHRMYLPLAAVIVLAVVAVHAWAGRWSVVVFVPLAVVCIFLSARRNQDYRSEPAIWSDTIAKRPGNARAYNNLGNGLVHLGRVDEAIADFRTAIQISPDYFLPYNNLGAALVRTGRVNEGLEMYHKALRLMPNDPETRNNLGVALARLGRSDEAIDHYRVALKFRPEFAQARYNLGNALAGLGRFEAAAEQYREAVRIDPTYAQAYNNLGNALSARGQADQAIECYRQALRCNPAFAEAHNNLGNAMVRAGRPDEAIDHYREAVRIAPDYANAHRNLAAALAMKGRLAQAADQYAEALRLNPNDPQGHFGMGQVLVRLGRRTEAVAQLTEALRLQPNNAEARRALETLSAPPGSGSAR
jgi:protein O-mannosyl-transferase